MFLSVNSRLALCRVNVLHIAFSFILGTAMLGLAGCTFGLVHTREATHVRLYFRSAADVTPPTDPVHRRFLGAFQNYAGISAVLVVKCTGHHVEVFSPEGPFPERSDEAIFLMTGAGSVETLDGSEWFVYRLPKNLKDCYERCSEATVRISKDYSIVRLEVKPSPKYKWSVDRANISGRYKINDVFPREIRDGVRMGSQPPAAEPARKTDDGEGEERRADPPRSFDHIISEGETFRTIAESYGIREEAIRKANPKIKGDADLRPNALLVIPVE